MIIRLHRAGPDHRCLRPTVFVVSGDLWRCPECGQRWRAEQIQPGAWKWQSVNFWRWWLGL